MNFDPILSAIFLPISIAFKGTTKSISSLFSFSAQNNISYITPNQI